LITLQVVARVRLQDRNDEEPPDRDRDGDEAPETPLDEPRPPRIDDPPPQPVPKGPYVVRGLANCPRSSQTEAQR